MYWCNDNELKPYNTKVYVDSYNCIKEQKIKVCSFFVIVNKREE